MSNDLRELERALSPLHVYRDFTTDSTVLRGSRTQGRVDSFALTVARRPVDAIVAVLEDMAERDPFVARYRRDEEIEIHPVFGGASLPELLAWP